MLIINAVNGCKELHNRHNHPAKCSYLKASGCRPSAEAFISYLHLIYCSSPSFLLALPLLLLWLLILVYLLADTASTYFSSSLQSLSRALKLSPAIAGLTLLSLGNGAPDVFSGIASFMGDGDGDTYLVGLSTILGGALFVSTSVVGIICISIRHSRIQIDKSWFIRNILVFLVFLLCLLGILISGKVNLWGAICFLSLYPLYVFMAFTTRACRSQSPEGENPELGESLLPCYVVNEGEPEGRKWSFFEKLVWILELPLSLPRRLTIPVVSEEKWSKPFAVASATMAPVLQAAIWSSGASQATAVGVGGLAGISLGVLAFFTTEKRHPPRKLCLLLGWLAGGFVMSITWTYVVAQELVALLVSLGLIFGLNPSILGLTVLAWGNSMGDLVANLSMAREGAADGVEVAISGCYAGPIFNTLVGLGLSLALGSWAHDLTIPTDTSVYETLGFLVGGLLWALVVLPKRNMRPDRFLGIGLLSIYLGFLCLKFSRTLQETRLLVAGRRQ